MRKGLMVLTLAAAFTAGMAMTSFAGWSQKNGNWYYYNDSTGKMVQDDWVKVNEKWYYMDSNGVMRTNSLIDDTYYVNSSGEMVLNEWRELSDNWDHEGGWRYFGANGKAYENGWKQIHDVWYYFNNSDNGHRLAGSGRRYLLSGQLRRNGSRLEAASGSQR